MILKHEMKYYYVNVSRLVKYELLVIYISGFFEARKACCGTGLVETSILCNAESSGTCRNASEYVFWDGFHPTDAANKILSDDLLTAGLSLIS